MEWQDISLPLLGGAVSWNFCKHTIVTRYTFEAELYALDVMGMEAEWLHGLMSRDTGSKQTVCCYLLFIVIVVQLLTKSAVESIMSKPIDTSKLDLSL